MLRSVDDPGADFAVVAGASEGAAVDSFNLVANHMFRSTFMVASIMNLESLDNRVRARLADVIAELDCALTELRHTAIAPLAVDRLARQRYREIGEQIWHERLATTAQCQAVRSDGNRCRNRAKPEGETCWVHDRTEPQRTAQ